jgi:hypothetical protein
MDKVANLPAAQRRDLFREVAATRGMSPAVIEKDFWVCWVLKRLFSDPQLRDRMVFKGGTSLSKVFSLIDRFSEDIDLILDWQLLGYGPGQKDPYRIFDSKTKQDRLHKELNAAAAKYISGTLVDQLNANFSVCPGVSAAVDAEDPHTVNVVYPAAFSESYLRPAVRLEIGPLASWVPSAAHSIRPYAGETFPKVFDEPVCPVVAIAAERTFWEKATILHQEAYRKEISPPRYSRHYYDFHKLARSAVKKAALADQQLLKAVVTFKQRFYPSASARYDLAQPGSFKLIPNDGQIARLKTDYQEMRIMIFGDAPDFESIIATLSDLEKEINRLPHSLL